MIVFFVGYCAGVISSVAGAIIWQRIARSRSERDRRTT